MRISIWKTWAFLAALAATSAAARPALAVTPVVPGSGEQYAECGDDMEDPEWTYVPNLPKSSSNLDHKRRSPVGFTKNGRWSEGHYRGAPDIIRRVPTPPDGLPGSTHALLMRTLHSGVPGSISNTREQDDFFLNVRSRIGGYIPVSRTPSLVVRVYIPEFDQWEQINGSSFGVRADVRGMKPSERKVEPYWPGMFIQLIKGKNGDPHKAVILVRGNQNGNDLRGPEIHEPGWWTLGMSFTPDGSVHYYASPGVDDLTQEDHIYSNYPYGFRCQRVDAFFFNVVNANNGQSWSTPWIIDDPAVFSLRKR